MNTQKIIVKETKSRGRGIFAAKRIKKGELIAEFDGPIITIWYRKWSTRINTHAVQIGRHRWRILREGSLAYFANHSCEPNCGIKNYNQLVAMKTIEPGEEITWDYEMTEDNDLWRMKCKCGTTSCRKLIGAYRNMPTEIREKYKGYISEWLLERYSDNKKIPR